MNWYNKMPLSLRKRASDITELPEGTWVGKDPERAEDLGVVGDRAIDRLKGMLHYMEDELEPGELTKYHQEIENVLVDFLSNIYRIEEQLQNKSIESYEATESFGDVISLPSDED